MLALRRWAEEPHKKNLRRGGNIRYPKKERDNGMKEERAMQAAIWQILFFYNPHNIAANFLISIHKVIKNQNK
ncbi:MAG: hypothetical protein IJI37_00135 [Opitutales bacterium]|nr:hypothetical protein [Opitutales bacterium]